MIDDGFMDDNTGKAEKANTIRTEKVSSSSFSNLGRFAQCKDLNEGVVDATEPAVPGHSVASSPADNGPLLPGGRGSHDALTEAVMAAGRAMLASEGTAGNRSPSVSLQESSEALVEDCRPPLKRKVTNPNSVIEGDIVEHKESGSLGKVIESNKFGMKINLSGIGLVEVKAKQAKNYKLVGRRV